MIVVIIAMIIYCYSRVCIDACYKNDDANTYIYMTIRSYHSYL